MIAELRERRGAPTMSCSLNTVQYCQHAHALYHRTIVQCAVPLPLPLPCRVRGYTIVPATIAYRLLCRLLCRLCSARAWIMDSQASAVECSAGQPQASKRSGSCGECAEVCCGGVQCRGGAGGGAERMQIRCSCDVRGGAEASGRVRREGAEGGAQREDAEWRRGVEQRRGAGRHLRARGGSGPHHVIRLV